MTFELENLSSIHTTTHIHTQSKFQIFHKEFSELDVHGTKDPWIGMPLPKKSIF